MIRLKFNGKLLKPGDLEKAFSKRMIEAVAERVRERIGAIRHPETGECPRVVIMGDSLDKMSCKVEGSPELLALVRKHLNEGSEMSLETESDSPKAFLC